jgi:hypothetical protein
MKRFKAQQIYLIFIMLTLSVFLITGCGGGGDDNAGGSLMVSSTAPIATATGVCLNKEITATFSRAMQPLTITALGTFTVKETITTNNVPGLATYDVTTMTATFAPTANLTTGLNYTATITTAAKDLAGNALAANKIWSFTAGVAVCAPVVDLGLAAPFGIAAAAGIGNNTGATKINGDVVLDPTATCKGAPVLLADGPGFGACGGDPPTHNVGDLVITQIFPDITTADAVMADLNTAYLSLQPAKLPLATVLGGSVIGNGGCGGAGIGCAANFTLPPGVYIAASATSIGVTGVLILDGQGDPNARFVFQAGSTLTTATGSEIRLINSAKASNVWWQVGSSATIGVNAIFMGNVLADTSITMNTGSTSCGRLLAGAVTSSGAFTFDSNVVSVPGHPDAPAGCE